MVHHNSFGTPSSTDSSSGEALENKHAIVNGIHAIHWGGRNQDEVKPGWPLLRRTSLPSQSPDKEYSPRKMSLLQWVMSLPDRSPPESPQSSTTRTCSTNSESGFFTSSELLGTQVSEIPLDQVAPGFTWFRHEVLRQATSQFSSENLIGKGGNSQVYKGVLEDGKQVAVKVVKSSKQGRKDFLAEVNIVSSLRHKNITPLLGVCISIDELISVYHYMPSGSLEENLHGQKKQNGRMSWKNRYRVIIGIAEALVYLHNGCSNTVIHRDIKSSNILLSDDMDPQVSDFGLAIWAPKWESRVEEEVGVVGTFGYMAPEYVMYGKVTHKVDVYSFGVVLLELVCGRKPIIHSSCQGQESLFIWAKAMVESGRVVKELVDPSMEEERWDDAQMQRVVVAASLCLTRDARHRPNMPQILRLLKGEETWLSEQPDGVEGNNYDVDERLNNIIKSSHMSSTKQTR